MYIYIRHSRQFFLPYSVGTTIINKLTCTKEEAALQQQITGFNTRKQQVGCPLKKKDNSNVHKSGIRALYYRNKRLTKNHFHGISFTSTYIKHMWWGNRVHLLHASHDSSANISCTNLNTCHYGLCL